MFGRTTTSIAAAFATALFLATAYASVEPPNAEKGPEIKLSPIATATYTLGKLDYQIQATQAELDRMLKAREELIAEITKLATEETRQESN